MTFKYGLTLPAAGSHKLSRFKSWVMASLPDLDINLPVEAPTKTTSLTVRLRSVADRERLQAAFPATLP